MESLKTTTVGTFRSVWSSITSHVAMLGAKISQLVTGRHQGIIRDPAQDQVIPTLRYLFDSNPPPFHVSNDTEQSRLVALRSLRYLFRDMRFPRSYDTPQSEEWAFEALRGLFNKPPHSGQAVPSTENTHRAISLDDTALLKAQGLPKPSSHTIQTTVDSDRVV